MAKRAVVSVIVVAYNDRLHLDECLSGLLSQSYKALEITVVDNCSSDGTPAYVQERFPQVALVTCDRNVGYMGGVRRGLKRVRGEYVAIINPDTRPDPDWVDGLVAAVEGHCEAGASTSRILIHGQDNRVNAMGLNIHVTGLGFARGLNQPNGHGRQPDHISLVAGVSGCAFLVRRSVLAEIIDIVADSFLYHEDVELSWLIHLLGYKIYYVPNSVVHHKYSLAMDARKFYLLERNRLSMLMYSLQLRPFLAYSPLFALTELLVFVYALLKGPRYLWGKIRAWAFLVANRRQLIEKRRRVQTLRKISDWQLFRRFQASYAWDQLRRIIPPSPRLGGRGIR